jgi:catechol 2,3-dioxygenase
MQSTLQLTAIQLRVSDLARSIDFYVQRLGFTLVEQGASHAALSTGVDAAPILTLTEARTAAHPPRDSAGLFHAAVLFPTRPALAGWLQFSAAHGVDFEGFSDHGVSEAIYLSDPDGNGLEFYADRPRTAWPFANGELAMTTRPLEVRKLLSDAGPAGGSPLAGATWGHLHLRVTNLDRSERFYRASLGLDLMQGSFPGARFLAADGYHHHLGLNTWGSPRLPQPPDALGLVEATFARAGVGVDSTLTDPDGMSIRLQPALVIA